MLLAEQLSQLTELFSPAATCSVVTSVMLKMLDDPVWVVRVAACQVCLTNGGIVFFPQSFPSLYGAVNAGALCALKGQAGAAASMERRQCEPARAIESRAAAPVLRALPRALFRSMCTL